MSPHHYGTYIWPAYIITVAAFVWMIADSLLRTRRWRQRVKSHESASD